MALSLPEVPTTTRVPFTIPAATVLMVTVCSAYRDGEPLSVTRTVKVYGPGPWSRVGVQLKAPVLGLIVAPYVVPCRLKVSVFGWAPGFTVSGSVAVAVNTAVVVLT